MPAARAACVRRLRQLALRAAPTYGYLYIQNKIVCRENLFTWIRPSSSGAARLKRYLQCPLTASGGRAWHRERECRPATVTFAKASCTEADAQPKFILHIAPVDPRVLPDRPFDNRNFSFDFFGARFNRACLATVPLPAYPIRQLTVGQWRGGNAQALWLAAISPPPAPPSRSGRLSRADRRPARTPGRL